MLSSCKQTGGTKWLGAGVALLGVTALLYSIFAPTDVISPVACTFFFTLV